MLKVPLFRWALLVIGLVSAGVAVAAASLLLKRDPATWQVSSVEVSGHAAGGLRLALAGEGLPDKLRAMLLPAGSSGGADTQGVDIALPLYQIATDGRLAVVSTRDQRLLTLDVAESARPKILGGFKLSSQWQTPGESSINALGLIGSLAVVVKSKAGLALVDLVNPQAPRQVDFLSLPARLLDMQTSGDVAYVASDDIGLVAVTVTGERLVARQVPGSPPATRLAVDQRRLVTVGPKDELAVYRLDPKGQPELLAKMAAGEDVRDLVLTPEALFLCTSDGQLLSFTLEDWPRPKLAGRLSFKGRPLKLEWMPATRTLLCNLVGSGVAVIDVSRAAAPRLTGILPMAKMPISIKPLDERVFLAGLFGLKIVSDWEVLQVSPSPEIEYPFPVVTGQPSLLHWGTSVFVYNHMEIKRLAAGASTGLGKNSATGEPPPFLVLPDEQGVRLLALRDGMPTGEVVGRIPVSDGGGEKDGIQKEVLVNKVFWRDGRVFALSPAKISIFGVDRSGRLTSTEEFRPGGSAGDMAWIAPGHLIVALRDQGFQVVDVSQAGGARKLGEYRMPKHQQTVGAIKSLLVDGSRLNVARARLGVEIFDLADPASPRLVQRIDTPGYAGRLHVNDGLLLVTDLDQGVFVIDVSGPQAVAVGGYRLPIRAQEVLYDAGSGLFMIDSIGGVVRLPPPLRFAEVDTASGRRATLTLPAGVVPGRYTLAVYDDRRAVSLPVILQ